MTHTQLKLCECNLSEDAARLGQQRPPVGGIEDRDVHLREHENLLYYNIINYILYHIRTRYTIIYRENLALPEPEVAAVPQVGVQVVCVAPARHDVDGDLTRPGRLGAAAPGAAALGAASRHGLGRGRHSDGY